MKLRTKTLLLVLVGLLSLVPAACAQRQLPTGYEALKTDVQILEASHYIESLRDSYVDARRRGVMRGPQFIQAVKADESLRVEWLALLEARKAGTDTAAQWAALNRAIDGLLRIIQAWLPADLRRPTLTGAK